MLRFFEGGESSLPIEFNPESFTSRNAVAPDFIGLVCRGVTLLVASDAWFHVRGSLEEPSAGTFSNCALLVASEQGGEPFRIHLYSTAIEESVPVAPGSGGPTYYFSAERPIVKWQTAPAIFKQDETAEYALLITIGDNFEY